MTAGKPSDNCTPAKSRAEWGPTDGCYHVWRMTQHTRDAERNLLARVNRCLTRSAANKLVNRKEDALSLQYLPDGRPDVVVLRCRPYCGCRKPRVRNAAPCPALGGRPAGEWR